ncbi:MAG TPA: class I SAM-dependent methyltransferase [Solirubrobacterales bacterium]|jgi:SAM-dependent methyltransferase|nr:class I SAM-dependent methyltransferase [Solirubrobacterales bacterium]
MGRIYDATWGRMFSAVYDRGMAGTEAAGLWEMRRELLAKAAGRTIEIGAGTGANLELYPPGVGELVLAEPDPHMVKQLRRKLASSGRDAEVVEAPAERLPFADASFDTAVATLVFCTVADPEAAVAEAARVLKPGGSLLFLEHVRSPEPGLARWQDRLERPWHFLGDGCHCNRDTVATIDAAGLELGEVERGRLPKAPPIVRPLARGSASVPT